MALGDADGPARVLISKAQADAVVEIAARDPGMLGVSDEGRASLVDMVVAGQWEQGDLARILKALEKKPKPESLGDKKERRKMQHWVPTVFSWFTSEEGTA